VHIEVEFTFEVVGAELSETVAAVSLVLDLWSEHCVLGFVPCDNRRKANLPHAREEGESGEDQRRPYEFVVVKEGDDVERLHIVSFLSITASTSSLPGLHLALPKHSIYSYLLFCLFRRWSPCNCWRSRSLRTSYISPPQLLRSGVDARCLRRGRHVVGRRDCQALSLECNCSCQKRSDSCRVGMRLMGAEMCPLKVPRTNEWEKKAIKRGMETR
jgi:hypothetical protein